MQDIAAHQFAAQMLASDLSKAFPDLLHPSLVNDIGYADSLLRKCGEQLNSRAAVAAIVTGWIRGNPDKVPYSPIHALRFASDPVEDCHE